MKKRTSQAEIDNIIESLSFKKTEAMTYSKQAFSTARQKLLPQVFVELSNELIMEYYRDGNIKRYRDHVLLAIDGCVHEIPDNNETRKEYGCVRAADGFEMARARTGSVYDVENGFLVSSIFEGFESSERDNAKEIIEKTLKLLPENEKKLFLFDRGYPSMEFIQYFLLLATMNVNFLMRVPKSFCKEANSTNTNDEWVEIEITNDRFRKLTSEIAKQALPIGTKLRIRVINVVLDTGEVETLITGLDEDELPYEEAKMLYFRRWGVETKFDELKNKFQIENYSGEKPIIIEQDYYCTIFLSNLASLLEKDAQEKFDATKSQRNLKYEEYKINRSILISKFKDNFIHILLEEDDSKKSYMYDKLISDLSRNVVPVIKGRKYNRKKQKQSNKYSKARKRLF